MPPATEPRASDDGGRRKEGGDLFIVDNSDSEWKVRDYLREWTDIAHAFDIATGYFEIGSLLALDGEWQKLDKLRILMGDEVTKRTKKALAASVQAVAEKLDASIEREKEANDFLRGVPSIVEALRDKRIECRVYARQKFHAKTYITHPRQRMAGSNALVGSSNFTLPGLTQNVEMNIRIELQHQVALLQEWYESHWNQAEDITPEILKVIERHTREYTPFEVYVKALHEYFRGHEMSVDEWERTGSRIYPLLDKYQQEGYQALMKISRKYNGAFLCDGVGLGKTFIGMMVIERLLERERKRVALFVPKSARGPVWEKTLDEYLPHLHGVFSNLIILNHTDLSSDRKERELERVKEMADCIVIDEAHHFRNPGVKGEGGRRASRYRRMFEMAEGKTLFMLTATPVNNRLTDLQRMMELFSRRRNDYFKEAPLGIHSLPAHFRRMEKELEKAVGVKASDSEEVITDQSEAGQVLANDLLFRELVVQRSRAYVRASQLQQGVPLTLFPEKLPPQVADYSVKRTYGRLLAMVDAAFSKEKPLFSLAVYDPYSYFKGDEEEVDVLVRGRQKQVVALIRTQFLKRFESSAHAFRKSCEALLAKLLAFIMRHGDARELSRLERWKAQKAERVGFIRTDQPGLFNEQLDLGAQSEQDSFDDLVPEELLAETPLLPREEFKVEEIINETFLDLDQLVDFLDELKKFKPSNDDKLKALVRLLKSDPVLKKHKVLIFTEFRDTALYLLEHLNEAGVEGVEEIDGLTKEDRGKIIRRFAPYYNGSSSGALAEEGGREIRVLISTDVLSEGLNLQDATRLVNYDLHWNPVRLMQRIGRVDRRMNAQTEARLLADHPEQGETRGRVAYWNFLPPEELDDLLRLYARVTHKTLRISRVFGIEGKKLLKPEDDYEALKDFTHNYEGTTTPTEGLHLEYQRLTQEHPSLAEGLDRMPRKVFSGKRAPAEGTRAVFFCYTLPAQRADVGADGGEASEAAWTEEAGRSAWYLYDLGTGKIEEDANAMVALIRSAPDTPFSRALPDEKLSDVRSKVERHIRNGYLKQVQAPAGVRPTLRAWMEIA
jgi:superfamily II DNA or RNA helicase